MPTRGLIFTDVMEAINREVSFNDGCFFFTSRLPIPQSFNSLVKDAILSEKHYEKFSHFL